MSASQLRVCYFGTYRDGYTRNRIMIEGLRRAGVEVTECHEELWHGIEDRVEAASGGWIHPSFILRLLRAGFHLLRRYRRIGDYDVMVLGYPGQLDAPLARLLTWWRRKPLVLDVFMSIYLIAQERGLTARSPLTGRLIRLLEELACRLPDLLILDTAEYVQWFAEAYDLDPARFRLVPTGADDRVFHPVQVEGRDDDLFRVLYYGTFIPNHGVESIVEAARILRDETDIHFELVGEGPTKAGTVALAQEYALTNVTFTGWIDEQSLSLRVAEADICLGAFGTTPQSMMTVQNKIYEALAMRKCVVTGRSLTVSKALTHGKHAWLCDRESGESLAQAILTLRQSPGLCRALAEQGHRLYMEHYTTAALGKQFSHALMSPADRELDAAPGLIDGRC